jgi:2-keto-myo-inositol isomerase
VKLGLNGATIMRSPIEQDVEVAAACGYSALEFWAAKVDAYVSSRPLEELAEQVQRSGLTPWCINSIEGITCRDDAGRRKLLAELRRRVTMARTLGAPSIVVVPSQRSERLEREAAIADAVEVLRAMSDAAGDVSLAFEFLGKPGCTVPTLDMAVEIVERVERANVGMVLDGFHFYAGGSDLADLHRMPIDRLVVVHLNGCEDRPRSELTDAHRLYPGEGVIPGASILRILKERGYDGVASVEIFRPEYWTQNPRDVARRAKAGAVSVLEAAGYEVGVAALRRTM